MDSRTPNSDRVHASEAAATTGHEWDGIEELNNPLPRWWLWIFYATILWSIAYWIVYPAWPLISGYTSGVFGWRSRTMLAQDLADLEALRAPMTAKLNTASLDAIRNEPDLLGFAQALGKTAFADNCAPCHGAGGGGARGFPNLNDDDWLWGGSLAAIETTINHGIRSTVDEQTRQGAMPAFTGVLDRPAMSAVADHVRSLSGLPVDPKADLAAGAKIFADNCAACHGEAGRGNREVGAPDLTDAVWFYGADKAVIVEGIAKGRGAVMPAWANRLDPPTIKAIALYVHSLGGGE
jgi:cytochrome c oxidase cbb3-type subunit 3